jgi:hypothetical protein
LDDEAVIAWQEALDEIAAGRPDDIACPFCNARPLKVERRDGTLRVSCPSCKRYVEGVFQGV